MESSKDIIILLKSLELQMVKMENRLLNMERKMDRLLGYKTPDLYPQVPFHPDTPYFPKFYK